MSPRSVLTLIFLSAAVTLFLPSCGAVGRYRAMEATNDMLVRELAENSNRIADLQMLLSRLENELSNTQSTLTNELTALEKTHKELTENLQNEISNGQVRVDKIKNVLTLNIAEQIFFESGRADIKPEGLKVLSKLADILSRIPDKMVRVEGHTDNVPIASKLTNLFKSNWDLAAARALNVVRFLSTDGRVSPYRLMAVSYGEFRPLYPNTSDKNRAANRRIEIVLLDKEVFNLMQTRRGLETDNKGAVNAGK